MSFGGWQHALGFQGGGKSNKHVLKNWKDYSNNWPLESSTSTVWSVDRLQCIRSFVEEVDCPDDELEAVMREDMCEDREAVVCVLVDFVAKLSSCELQWSHLHQSQNCDEERGSSDRIDILENALHLIEVTLRSFQASSSALSPATGTNIVSQPIPLDFAEDCIRSLISTLQSQTSASIPIAAATVRVFRGLIISLEMVQKVLEADALNSLVQITQANLESALLQPLLHLLILIIGNYRFSASALEQDGSSSSVGVSHNGFTARDFMRSRTHSVSSAGSYSNRSNPAMSKRAIKMPTVPSQQSLAGSSAESDVNNKHEETSSLPGVNLAWNVLNQLIKLTPLSSAWLSTQADNKDSSDMNLLVQEGELKQREDRTRFLSHLPHSIDDIEAEELRIGEMLTSTNDDEFASECDKVLLTTSTITRASSGLQVTYVIKDSLKLIKCSAEQAATPADVLCVMSLVLTVLTDNRSAQQHFEKLDGHNALLSMIIRVEESLVLIAPASNRVSLPGQTLLTTSTSAPETSLFHSPFGKQFDDYYCGLLTILAKMVLDEPFTTCNDAGFDAFLNWRGFQVRNVSILQLVKGLLSCNHPTLVTLGNKLIQLLIRINPLNIVSFEKTEILATILSRVALIGFKGTNDLLPMLVDCVATNTHASGPVTLSSSWYDGTNSPRFSHVSLNDVITRESSSGDAGETMIVAIEAVTLSMLKDSLSTVEQVAVFYGRREDSPLNQLLSVVLHLWIPPDFDNASPRSGMLRCSNCEVEYATLECVHETCVRDQTFRLCFECDKVFHKAALKRAHIRLPVCLPCVASIRPLDQLSEYDVGKTEITPQQRLQQCVSAIAQDCRSSYAAVTQTLITLHAEKLVWSNVGELNSWREVTTSLILRSVINIIQDKKKRGGSLSLNISDAVMALFRLQLIDHDCGVWSQQDWEDAAISELLKLLVITDAAGVDVPVPIEANAMRSKRVVLKLSIELLSLLVVSIKSGDHSGHQQQCTGDAFCAPLVITNLVHAQELLSRLVAAGIDGALLHCVLGDSQAVQLTSSDRQFVLWLLRELVVYVHGCLPALTTGSVGDKTSVLKWLHWLIACPLPPLPGSASSTLALNQRTALPAAMTRLQDQPSKKGSASRLMSATPAQPIDKAETTEELKVQGVPSGLATVAPYVRLMALQELRLLIMGYGDSVVSVANESTLLLSTIASDLSAGSHNVPIFSSAVLSIQMKELFVDSGLFRTVIDLSLGTRAPRFFAALLTKFFSSPPPITGSLSNGRNSSTPSVSQPSLHSMVLALLKDTSELELVLWSQTLALLFEVLRGCEKAKIELDQIIGVKTFAKQLLALTQLSSALTLITSKPVDGDSSDDLGKNKSVLIAEREEAVFVSVLMEVCVRGGQMFPAYAPFLTVDNAFPLPLSLKEVCTSDKDKSLCLSQSPCYYAHPIAIQMMQDVYCPVGVTLSYRHGSICAQKHFDEENALLVVFNDGRAFANGFTFLYSLPERSNPDERDRPPLFSGSVTDGSGDGSPRPMMRRTSKKNLTAGASLTLGGSASEQDLQSKWESESTGTGRASTIIGDRASRGSFNSHQSVSAIFQALKATPAHAVLGSDMLDLPIPSTGSAGGAFSATSPSTVSRPRTTAANAGVRPPLKRDASSSTADSLTNIDIVSNDGKLFLFPHTPPQSSFSEQIRVLALSSGLDETSFLLLVHNMLLIRSGLHLWMSDFFEDSGALMDGGIEGGHTLHSNKEKSPTISTDAISGRGTGMRSHMLGSTLFDKDITFQGNVLHSVEGYHAMLRRHVGLYVCPTDNAAKPTNSCSRVISCDKHWHAAFLNLRLRSTDSLGVLLALTPALSRQSQSLVLNNLYKLIDCHPKNTAHFTASEAIPLVLIRLFPQMSSFLQDAFGELLSRMLGCHVHTRCLRQLLQFQSVCSKSTDLDSTSPIDVSVGSAVTAARAKRGAKGSLTSVNQQALLMKALFIIGKACELNSPKATLMLRGDSAALNSGLVMPPITGVLQPFGHEVSLCSWIRLGQVRAGGCHILCQLTSADMSKSLTIYFRKVFSSFHATAGNDETCSNCNENIQLCVSVSALNSDLGESVPCKDEDNVANGDSLIAQRSCWTSGVTHLLGIDDCGEEEGAYSGTAGPVMSSPSHAATTTTSNKAPTMQSVVNTTSSSATTNGIAANSDQSKELHRLTSCLAVSIASLSLPDFVIDYPWVEVGDWHLLQISLQKQRLACSIDGVHQPVLVFSPFGYVESEKVLVNPGGKKVAAVLEAIEKSSKDHPVTLSLGGLFSERQHVTQLRALLGSSLSATNSPHDINAMKVANAMERCFFGFDGFVADFMLTESVPDSFVVSMCVNDGPIGGLRHIKQRTVLSLSQGELLAVSPSLIDDCTSVTDTDPATLQPRTAAIGSEKESWLEQQLRRSYTTTPSVRCYRNTNIAATFKQLGGLKTLFPLLTDDSLKGVATLRILGGLIFDEDSFQEFKVEQIDKALLFLFRESHVRALYAAAAQAASVEVGGPVVNTPTICTVEFMQVVFDLILHRCGASPHPSSLSGTTEKDLEAFHRIELLQMLIDWILSLSPMPGSTSAASSVVVASVAAPSSLAHPLSLIKAVVDWLRHVSDDHRENSGKLLKLIGMNPFFVLLTRWNDELFKSFLPIGTLSQPSPGGVSGVPSESFKKGLFETRPPLPPSDDAEVFPRLSGGAHPLTALHGNSDDALTVGFSVSDASKAIVEMFKVQTAIGKLMKVMIFGTAIDNFTLVNADGTMVQRHPDFTIQHLHSLFLFGIRSARMKVGDYSDDVVQSQSMKDKFRRSEKAKLLLRGTFGPVKVLKYLNIFHENYWNLSAAALCLSEVMSVLEGHASSILVISLRNMFGGIALANIALDLMISVAVEIRVIGIRMLKIFFSGSDGKLDVRQLQLFERIGGFSVMSEQLTHHKLIACDDTIFEQLFALIFWKGNSRIGDESDGMEADDQSSLSTSGLLSVFGWSNTPDPAAGNRSRQSSVIRTDVNASTPSGPSTGKKTVSQHSSQALFNSGPSVPEMILPQVLEVVFRLLQLAKSPEQVRSIISRVEDCCGLDAAHMKHWMSKLHTGDSGATGSALLLDEDVFLRNIEQFFICKDWIIHLTETIVAYRRKWLNPEALESNTGGLSFSESESLTATSLSGSGALAYSRNDSFPDQSTEGGESGNGDWPHEGSLFYEESSQYHYAQQSHLQGPPLHLRLLQQFSEPIFMLLHRLLSVDLLQKASGTRRWNEVFRLSLPEWQSIQEEVIHSLIDAVTLHEFVVIDCTEVGLNYVKNVTTMFDLMLERCKVTMKQCVKIVQVLHVISYRCSNELRNRLAKDTIFYDVRKSFIIRCLIDVGQDLPIRVQSLIDILPSLQAFLSSNDGKHLTDAQAVSLVLGMYIEVFDELQAHLSAQHQNYRSVQSESMTSVGIAGDGSMMSAPIPIPVSSIDIGGSESRYVAQQRVRESIDVMIALVDVVQLAVSHSQECRRTILRLTESMPQDPSGFTLKLFTNALKPLPAPVIKVNSTLSSSSLISGQSSSTANSNAVTTGAPTTTTASSASSWWSWGSSSTTPAAKSNSGGAVVESDAARKSLSPETTVPETDSSASVTIAVSEAISLTMPGSSPAGSLSTSLSSSSSQSLQQASDAGASATADPAVSVSVSPGGSPIVLPQDTRSYLYWFCAHEQSELQTEVRSRILRELKSVVRVAEKLRERYSQKLLKHTKGLQDKRLKNSSQTNRVVQETVSAAKIFIDKASLPWSKEVAAWVKAWNDRLQIGSDIVESKGKSSAKTSKSDAGVANAASSYELENFVIPDSLKDFLEASVQAQSTGYRDPVKGLRALHLSTTSSPVTASASDQSHGDYTSNMEAFSALLHLFETAKLKPNKEG